MDELENIVIEGTSKTPQIDFNHLTGELVLSGKSIPANAAKLYEPLLNWINYYIRSPRHITNLRLNLEYYNSASSLWIAKMVRELSRIKEDDCILFIHVYFDIEDFEDMEMEEVKSFVGAMVDNIENTSVSIGVKAYGTEESGKVVRESMILI